MRQASRVLLIEHLDAIGAAPADARERVAALRLLGIDAVAAVLDASCDGELLYDSRERRPGAGVCVFPDDAGGREALQQWIAAAGPARVLWAAAQPGGGPAARLLPADVPAAWWPAGYAPAAAEPGPLPALFEPEGPEDGSLVQAERLARGRLALWDGPFVLLPARPDLRTAGRVVDAFSRAVLDGQEADLVVLDEPTPALEAAARGAGVGMRVHFVGRAPREAETNWLSTAAVTLVSGETPIAGGWLLRALACGCPLLAVGEAADPLAAWLARAAGDWPARTIRDALEQALERVPAVREAVERGRLMATAYDLPALAARLQRAMPPLAQAA